MDKVELGEKIRQLRKDAKLSQRSLSAQSGVAYATLQDIEAGRGNPTLDTLVTLADSLGTSLDALTGRPAFAKSHVAEKLATQSRVQEHWIEAARLLSAIAQASPLRRLIALYILSNDERYIQELRTLAGSAPIVQFLKKIP